MNEAEQTLKGCARRVRRSDGVPVQRRRARRRRAGDRQPARERARLRRLGASSRARSRSSAATRRVRVLVIRADGRGFQAGVDVKELAKDGSLIVRGEPRLLRHLRRDLRLPGAGDLRRARLLPRRRHRHRGLVRPRARVGGRDLRPARDRPRRDGRRHARDAHVRHAGGAAHAAARASRSRRAEAYRLGGVFAVVPREKLRDAALELAREDRRKSPRAVQLAKQVAERHRAARRRSRATASSRASRSSSTPRPTRRSRATPSSRSATRSSTGRSRRRWISRYTPEQDAFRAEARAWLEANVPAEPLPSFDTREGFARPPRAGSRRSTPAARRWCRGRSSTAGAARTCSSG